MLLVVEHSYSSYEIVYPAGRNKEDRGSYPSLITRHVTVVMQLANPRHPGPGDIARSAGPILHDMDRTLTPSTTKNKRMEKVLVA